MNYANSMTFGASDEMDALIYGETHPNTVNFLRNQYDNFSSTLAAPALAFMQKGREVFERFNGSEAMRFARNVIQNVLGTTTVEMQSIRYMSTMESIQNSNITMQRWVMANPTVREMYHNQKCDGYSDTYVDMEPEFIKGDHYDYRRVMNGVMEISEDDCKFTTYFDELKEGDRELLLEEKLDIIQTWEAMDVLMALCKEDPTSNNGGML